MSSLDEDLKIVEEEPIEIDVKHPDYSDMIYIWTQMDDSYEGTVAIKRKNQLYLPMPASFEESAESPSSDNTISDLYQLAPFYHRNKAYSSYLQRARFPDIFKNSVSGFIGVALKDDPVVNLPNSLAYLEDSATIDGLDLKHLYSDVCKALMTSGRIVLVADVDEDDNEIKILIYKAVDMPNWDTNKKGIPNFVVLQEIEQTGNLNSDKIDVKFVLMLDNEESSGKNSYSIKKYIDGQFVSQTFPSCLGKKCEEIPVTCINSTHIGFSVSQPPLQGVSDIAISMYQKDADLSHSEYMTCNPMLYGTGIDEDDKPSSVGSQIMYCLGDVNAKLGYAEPSGAAHSHMVNRIKELKNEAASYGAAFLSDGSKGVEAAETARINKGAKTANLREVCIMAEMGILDIVQKIARWKMISDKIEFTVEKDFVESKLNPQEQNSLLQSWMNNGIAHETYLNAMVEGNVLPKDLDVKSEIEKTQTEAPNFDLGKKSDSSDSSEE